MTIKNTQKNVSAENSDVVQNITNVAATKDNNVSNFKTDQTITVTFFNFFDDTSIANGDTPTSTTIKIPLAELVRKGYLEDKYYDKAYIDAKVRPHFEIIQSVPNKTPKQWAQEVREAGKTNVIFLVPFGNNPSWEENNDNPDEQFQEGGFEEYFYTVEDNQDGTPNYATEKMEKKGSLALDLRGYLLENNFNATLIADSSFINHENRITTNETDIGDLKTNKMDKTSNNYNANAFVLTDGNKTITTNTKVGNISSAGKLMSNSSTDANKILTSDSNGIIIGSSHLNTTQIKNTNALAKINTSANATQSDINTAINSLFNTLYTTDLPSYLLKADIPTEIWGTTGFASEMASETDPNVQSMKLGEYIYRHLYNKFSLNNHVHGDITSDGKIGTTSGLPLITTTAGKITVGSFGTTAGTFATGNHVHGNIKTNGAIGTTSGLPLITTTNGVVTTGSFGTVAGTFAEGNHTHSEYAPSANLTDYIDADELNEVQDNYVIFVNAKEVCDNLDEFNNVADENKTVENLLHVFDNDIESALLEYMNETNKEQATIISFNDVGTFFYQPDRESQSAISGTVTIIQPDLISALPVSLSDLVDDVGYLTTTDLTAYLKDIDVIDNLTSSSTTKPLSANQGRVLAAAIPTTTSQLTNTAGFVTLGDISGVYLPLTGGTLTGPVIHQSARATSQDNLVFTGTITPSSTTGTASTDIFNTLRASKSLLATLKLGSNQSDWYHAISVRYQDTNSTNNGFHIYTPYSSDGDLKWRRDIGSTSTSDKTILDSSNYSNYAFDTAGTNLTSSGSTVMHDVSGVTAVNSVGMYKIKYDAQGHITGASTIEQADITGLGISASDHTHNNYFTTAGTNLTSNGQTINHDASGVTAVNSVGMYKIKYDAQGHITGASAIEQADVTGLGISASDHTHNYATSGDITSAVSTHNGSNDAHQSLFSSKIGKGDIYQTIIDVENLNNTAQTCNVKIDEQMVIKITLKDFNGNAVANQSISVSVDKGSFYGYLTNGNTINAPGSPPSNAFTDITLQTDSNGVVRLVYTASEWGVATVSCNETKIQLMVGGTKYTEVTSVGNASNTFSMSGAVQFRRTGNIVTVSPKISYTLPSSANQMVFVCNIPNEFIPTDPVTLGYTTAKDNNGDSSGNTYLGAFPDISTSSSRQSYYLMHHSNNVLQLFVGSPNTSGDIKSRGQFTYFID